ncbi:MAG: pentapeptide repeat-containing protein [Algicola sp.]|nr:pentapeptide repeat-containing protein [Algicola sp.]
MAEPVTFISSKSLGKLLKALTKAWNKITGDRKKELIRINDNFGNCEDLARYYIEPNCQQVNPADECEDEAISMLRTNVFSTVNEFLNRDIVARDTGASQMFILADAGMGKTSLLMILKLTHLMSFWPVGYKCELLKLGSDTLEQIEKINDKSNTLLLLDSLDEDPQCKKGGSRERLTKLLEQTKIFRRVIITCRTQFFPDTQNSAFGTLGKITFQNFGCPLFYLSLFNDKQVTTYLKKRFPKGIKNYLSFEDNPKVEEGEKALAEIGSLQFRPFLLAHIEDIIESALQGANEYQLYESLIDTWLNREVIKLREKHGKEVKKEDLLTACIWLAETMHRNSKSSVPLDVIKKLCIQESCIELLSGQPERVVDGIDFIDIGTNSLLNRDSDGRFRFSHLSIMEFLIAYGIAGNVISGIDVPIIITDKIRRLLNYVVIKEPFHFVNAKGGYYLVGIRLSSLSQLDGRSMENAEFQFSEFFCEFLVEKHKREKYDICVVHINDAELRKIDLSHKSLGGSSFANSNLAGANLTAVDLRSADLNGVDLSGANLVGTNFFQSELKGAILTKAVVSKETNFFKADMRGVKLNDTNLVGIELQEIDMTMATLSNANLQRVNMSKSDLTVANLESADLSEANLSNAILNGANLKGANLKGANLEGANLAGANLKGANLEGTNLEGANFTDANLTDVNLTHAVLTPKQFDELQALAFNAPTKL